MLAALGVAAANILWLILAATGAAALAVNYPQAFLILKYIGLLVIIWLGITIMRSPAEHMFDPIKDVPPRKKLFLSGLVLQSTQPHGSGHVCRYPARLFLKRTGPCFRNG